MLNTNYHLDGQFSGSECLELKINNNMSKDHRDKRLKLQTRQIDMRYYPILRGSKKLKANKSPGPDKITNENIKAITPFILPYLTQYF